MSVLPEMLNELFERDERLRRDIHLILGLSCQERHFLSRTAQSCGLPPGEYIRSLIRAGGDPLLPPRQEE